MRARIAIIQTLAQQRCFLVMWTLAMGGTAWIQWTDLPVFHRFLGEADPLLVIFISGILGVLALLYLRKSTGIQIIQKKVWQGFSIPLLGALFFGCLAIGLDQVVGFSEDLNVAFPVSLVFYPSIGFVAEVIFHVLPLTLLISIFNYLIMIRAEKKVLQFSTLLAAIVEPLYQGIFLVNTGLYSSWEVLLTVSHIFLFNLFQFKVFRKQGFLNMYLVRILYYLIWHVAWGYFRLN